MNRAASGPRVGKRVGGALYLHREAIGLLDAPHRIRVAEASDRAAADWNVVKLEEHAISLLLYEDFDTSGFPCLLESVRLDGDRITRTDYRSRENPPILHRKELLLRHDDDRIPSFSSLTRMAEERGLFTEPHRIGTRRAWADRISGAGLKLDGHGLVPVDTDKVEIVRHRTAIVRSALSAPMQALVRHDYIRAGSTVLDYGCGQGDDVRALVDGGIAATGWDPHFRPDGTLPKAEAVNLGFVLNVIEDPAERVETLRRAWGFCNRVMAVAVMIAGHRPTTGLRPYGDGYVTARGTFQRYFTPEELKGMVRDSLGVEAVVVGLGVVLAFRDPLDEANFLFRRQVRRVERSVSFRPPPRERVARMREPLADRLRPALDALWSVMLDLGRPPTADELPPEVAGPLRKSNCSVTRAVAWCEELYDRADLVRSASERREDLLLYFALGAFTGSIALRDLASALQRDARVFFGGVSKAREAAMAFLFSLRDSDRVNAARLQAIERRLAYGLGDAGLHFRQARKDEQPLVIRGLVGCASVLYGDLDEVDVILVDTARMHVDLICIADFEAKLPIITRRSRVDLKRQSMRDRVMTGDDQRVFLARSCYASGAAELSERRAIERRVAGLSGVRIDDISVRHGDLVQALKAASL